MSNKSGRPPIVFGGRQRVGCTTLFDAYNFFQIHRVTGRLYLPGNNFILRLHLLYALNKDLQNRGDEARKLRP